MNLAPVIDRELRVEARGNLCFWLRILGAGSMIAVMTVVLERGDALGSSALGHLLFNVLNQILLVAILIVAPLLTADCISKERREGTLGLLFLTPLKALEVVWAKAAIQILRGLMLVLSALPVMGLPFVLGGVTVGMGIQAALVHLGALLLGLTAGLLASSKNVEWIPALIKAELLGAMVAFAFRGFLVSGFDGRWMTSLRGFFIALLFFLAIIKFAAEKVKDHSRGDSGIQRPALWVSLFSSSEFWQGVFRWDKGPTLDKNPIAWLQEYSWSARLAKWAWVALVQFLIVICGFFSPSDSFFIGRSALLQLTYLVAAGMAFTATASFRRERENGALELLLVTPLTPAQLIRGRLWGVFCHFFPVGAILSLYWMFEISFGNMHLSHSLSGFHALSTIIYVPIVGLAVSLLRMNFILAWLVTSIASFVLPSLVMALFGMYSYRSRPFADHSQLCLMVGVQVYIGIRIARAMIQKLTDRTFDFGTA